MPRILLVADDIWVINDVQATASLPATTVDVLDDPTQVAEQAASGHYDVILVDLQVKSMGGMAVTREVKDAIANGELDSIPVVMLLDRSADTFLAVRAGAEAHLVKPFTAQELRATLDQLLVEA